MVVAALTATRRHLKTSREWLVAEKMGSRSAKTQKLMRNCGSRLIKELGGSGHLLRVLML